jgi:predicted  nucleic acid-binding Zn-ribbon protein
MEQEIQVLSERIERLLVAMRRLGDEHLTVKQQLNQALGDKTRLQEKLDEARIHVQTALAQLPKVYGQKVADHGTD